MRTICCICLKPVCDTADDQYPDDIVSHGMHEECAMKYYSDLDLTPKETAA